MIDEIIGGCLETFGHWIFGVVFFIASLYVAFGAPSSDHPWLIGFLAYLLFHTSVLLIVGVGFNLAKRFLAISWLVLLIGFIAVSAFVASK